MAVLRNQFVKLLEKNLLGVKKKLDKDKDGDIDAKDLTKNVKKRR